MSTATATTQAPQAFTIPWAVERYLETWTGFYEVAIGPEYTAAVAAVEEAISLKHFLQGRVTSIDQELAEIDVALVTRDTKVRASAIENRSTLMVERDSLPGSIAAAGGRIRAALEAWSNALYTMTAGDPKDMEQVRADDDEIRKLTNLIDRQQYMGREKLSLDELQAASNRKFELAKKLEPFYELRDARSAMRKAVGEVLLHPGF